MIVAFLTYTDIRVVVYELTEHTLRIIRVCTQRARPRRDAPVEATRETTTMPLRLGKKVQRVARAIAEEVNVARGVGARTDKHGRAKTSLWDRGKVRGDRGDRREERRTRGRGERRWTTGCETDGGW